LPKEKKESAKKLTTSKLIAYNSKMLTNSMIKSKSLNVHVYGFATLMTKSLIESAID
jgi:hypothetical protein